MSYNKELSGPFMHDNPIGLQGPELDHILNDLTEPQKQALVDVFHKLLRLDDVTLKMSLTALANAMIPSDEYKGLLVKNIAVRTYMQFGPLNKGFFSEPYTVREPSKVYRKVVCNSEKPGSYHIQILSDCLDSEEFDLELLPLGVLVEPDSLLDLNKITEQKSDDDKLARRRRPTVESVLPAHNLVDESLFDRIRETEQKIANGDFKLLHKGHERFEGF